MKKLIIVAIGLGLVAGAARLGLGLPPLGLDAYQPFEAVVLGLLAAWPLIGIVGAIVVMNPPAIERAAVGVISPGGMRARGELQGVRIEIEHGPVEGADGKRRLRQLILAKRPEGSEDLPVAVLARVAPAGVEGWSEMAAPPGCPDPFRLWVQGAGYRGGEPPSWASDAAALLADAPDVEEIRTGSEGARLIVGPTRLDPAVVRAEVLFVRRLVGPPLDDAKLDSMPSSGMVSLRRFLATALFLSGVPAMGLYLALSPTNIGTEAEAIAKMESCPLAMEAIGGEWRREMLGLQGSSTKGKRPRWRLYDILVDGAKQDGTLDVTTTEVRDEGRRVGEEFLRLDLKLPQRTIDILRCGDATFGMVFKSTGDGMVTAATPGAPVKAGESCTIEKAQGGNQHNCRLVIRCGTVTLFGAKPDLGYAVCGQVRTAKGTALVATDTWDGKRSEPKLVYDERTETTVLQDAAWKVDIALRQSPSPGL